jgi:hypothetical protein
MREPIRNISSSISAEDKPEDSGRSRKRGRFAMRSIQIFKTFEKSCYYHKELMDNKF